MDDEMNKLDDAVFTALMSRIDTLEATKALPIRARMSVAIDLTDLLMKVFSDVSAERQKSSRASEAATKRWAAAKAAAPKAGTLKVPVKPAPLSEIAPSIADPVPSVPVPPAPPAPPKAPAPTKLAAKAPAPAPAEPPIPPLPPLSGNGDVAPASPFGAVS